MFYNCIIWPGTESWFVELAFIVQKSIQRLGYECIRSSKPRLDCINVIIGANACAKNPCPGKIPKDSIIINFEQMYQESPHLTPEYIKLLKKYEVWDYNEHNFKWLKDNLNITSKILKIGYEQEFEIPKLLALTEIKEDIDVLFYGHLNERRLAILTELQKRFPDKNICFRSNNLWAKERDEHILRAKIVLNLHLYDAKLFEYPRVSFLLNNGKFVISETSTNDSEYQFLKNALVICEYDKVCDMVEKYLFDSVSRRQIADMGYDIFKQQKSSVPLPELEGITTQSCYEYRLNKRLSVYTSRFGEMLNILEAQLEECINNKTISSSDAPSEFSVCDISNFDNVYSVWTFLDVAFKNTSKLNTPFILECVRNKIQEEDIFELTEFSKVLNVQIKFTKVNNLNTSHGWDFVFINSLPFDRITNISKKVRKCLIVFSSSNEESKEEKLPKIKNFTCFRLELFNVYTRM